MAKRYIVQVVRTYRPLLRSLQVYNNENIDGNRYHQLRSIANAIGFTILFIAFIIGIISNAWFSINLKLDFAATTRTLSFLLCDVQVFLIAVSILIENRLIGKTIDGLQRLAETRKEIDLFELSFSPTNEE